MPPKGHRRRIAPGIYQDGTGYQAQVNGGRGPGNTQRFKPGTKLGVMKAWQRRRITELVIAPQVTPPSQRHTLRADIPRRLALIPDGPTRRTQDSYLAPWLATPLADRRRADITEIEVKQQRAAWLSEGYAASTVNKRVSALRGVYRELDPPGATNPCARITKVREPKPEPRGVTFALVEAILAEVRARRSRKLTAAQRAEAQRLARGPRAPYSAIARQFGVTEAMIRKLARGRDVAPDREATADEARLWLRVGVYTGLPHTQLAALRPEHIDWHTPAVWTTPRHKGEGTEGATVPLIPQAVDALRAFDAATLYGKLTADQARHYWEQARDAYARRLSDPALRALVTRLRPYDLRHTFLTEAYRHSGDHRAVGELGLHRDERTTRRYTLGAVTERAAKAAAALAAATSAATPQSAENAPK